MLTPTINLFHEITGHQREKKLRLTLDARYYHPEMQGMVDKFKCGKCKKHKLTGKGYGLFPEHETCSQPFEEVAVNLILPGKFRFKENHMNLMHYRA